MDQRDDSLTYFPYFECLESGGDPKYISSVFVPTFRGYFQFTQGMHIWPQITLLGQLT